MNKALFVAKIPVFYHNVMDLLSCAFEGGSNYWYEQLSPLKSTSKNPSNSDRFYENMIANGFELVDRNTGKKHKVKPKEFERAFSQMRNDYENHFLNLLSGNSDAETGDVFLQLLVFKDVIYG